MFNWLSWFETKDCGLNLFVINWLGVEKESLLTPSIQLLDTTSNKAVTNNEQISALNRTRC